MEAPLKVVLQCKFCGGKDCVYEDYRKWKSHKNTHLAIEGLFSNWVGDEIVATQRPSSRLIKEFNIIKQFKEKRINAIINLQQPGEHASCGDGLAKEGGFSYLPEEFMDHGIYFYNFGWEDLTPPSLEQALNVVHVMNFHIRQGQRVAIHCHAGLGRTGTIIACYLCAYDRMEADAAIDFVRKRRPKSVQTKAQVDIVRRFAAHVRELRIVFHPKMQRSTSLEGVMLKQKFILHGSDLAEFRLVPKVLEKLTKRLVEIKEKNEKAIDWHLISTIELDKDQKNRVEQLKGSLNQGLYTHLERESHPLVVAQLMLDWLGHLEIPLLPAEVARLINTPPVDIIAVLEQSLDQHAVHSISRTLNRVKEVVGSNHGSPFFKATTLTICGGDRNQNLTNEEKDYWDKIVAKLETIAKDWKPQHKPLLGSLSRQSSDNGPSSVSK